MDEPEKKNEEPKTQALPDRSGTGRAGKTRVGTGGGGGNASKVTTIVCCENDLLRSGIRAMLSPVAKIVAVFSKADKMLPTISYFMPKVVVLDPNFDNFNSLEICRQSADISPGTSFLIFSDRSRITRYLNQFIRAGARGFCLNSSGVEPLYDAFDQCSRGLPYCDPEITRVVRQTPANLFPNTNLTDREIEVLIRLNMSNKQIAEELDMKVRTIEKHVECILAKLKVPTRTSAALKAVQIGFTMLPESVTLDFQTGKSSEQLAAEELAQWAIGSFDVKGGIRLDSDLTVKDLAAKLSVIETEIIKRLMLKGYLRTIHQIVEVQLAHEIAIDMGYTIDLS